MASEYIKGFAVGAIMVGMGTLAVTAIHSNYVSVEQAVITNNQSAIRSNKSTQLTKNPDLIFILKNGYKIPMYKINDDGATKYLSANALIEQGLKWSKMFNNMSQEDEQKYRTAKKEHFDNIEAALNRK